MSDTSKNRMEEKPGMHKLYYEHQSIFIDFVTRLLNVIPIDAKEKLSADTPLGKLINTANYKDIFIKTYLNAQSLSDSKKIHLFYKDIIAVEIELYLDEGDLFKFTIIETLCAIPNTRDEEKYFNWYPFKSKIVTYVDFNEKFFNILMKVENGRITFLVRDDDRELYPFDKKLVAAVISIFENVWVPPRFRLL